MSIGLTVKKSISWLAFLMEVHQLFHSAYLKRAINMASLNTLIKTAQAPNFLLSLECCQNQMSSFFIMDVAFLCEENRSVEEKSAWNNRREWNKQVSQTSVLTKDNLVFRRNFE